MSLLNKLERKVKTLEKEKLQLEKGIMRYYRTTPPHAEVMTLRVKRSEVTKARKLSPYAYKNISKFGEIKH